jgi:SpoVK/Ycf46/Vps4 family AAA+-type ATPase
MFNPNVKWDDIIGLDSAKRTIKEAVVYPIKVEFSKINLKEKYY